MTKIIDLRFIGKWRGTDEGRLTHGETNIWMMLRKPNGTFEITFETRYDNGSVENSTETGRWYIENDIFFEHRDSDDVTDAYYFTFFSSQIIQFVEVNTENEKPYTFNDYKMNEN